uniref:Cyclin-like domain-containing protein n=1 Tax=Arcella intermedia TaxID=1963864 RepID=A0A6B2LDG6_9EUKA
MSTPNVKRRANTTWSMFIGNTMDTPNKDQIIDCVAQSIYFAISLHAKEKSSVVMEIFDERKHPLTHQRRSYTKLPKLAEIKQFVAFMFVKQNLAAQVGIMAIHYVDQLINKTGLLVTAWNWRRVLLAALLVADKFWEEDVVCNSDYCNRYFPGLTVDDLNQLEREFLMALDFKLVLKTSVYAEYYFALRSITGKKFFPSKPLDKETAMKLEMKQAPQLSSLPKRTRSISVGNHKTIQKSEEKVALSLEQVSQRLINRNSQSSSNSL